MTFSLVTMLTDMSGMLSRERYRSHLDKTAQAIRVSLWCGGNLWRFVSFVAGLDSVSVYSKVRIELKILLVISSFKRCLIYMRSSS